LAFGLGHQEIPVYTGRIINTNFKDILKAMQNEFRRENGTTSNIRTFFFIIYNAFTKHRLIPFFIIGSNIHLFF